MTAAREPGSVDPGVKIEDADQRLADWVGSVLTDVAVSFDPPQAEAEGRGVSLYLYEVRPEAPLRSRTPPLQASLRYLVTAWAPTQPEAHTLLGELIFAALDHHEMELEAESFPAEAWATFGVAVRPSFVLRVPLRRERQEQPSKLVRQRLVVQTAALVPLRGVVLGPEDIPLAGARIEIASLNLSTATDGRGRFVFPSVPGGANPTTLRVIAKGKELTLAARAASDEPLVIRFGPLED
ncbi:MAG: DUF4255 domain-containing protein [Dehalococcoidia bacterium]|nr:DUF4255 domain-containing protein [Dehalococcoidia bacterium]